MKSMAMHLQRNQKYRMVSCQIHGCKYEAREVGDGCYSFHLSFSYSFPLAYLSSQMFDIITIVQQYNDDDSHWIITKVPHPCVTLHTILATCVVLPLDLDLNFFSFCSQF